MIGGGEILRSEARSLIAQLLKAEITQVPGVLHGLAAYGSWAIPLLRQEDQAEHGSKEKLRLALALLPVDQRKVIYLSESLLEVSPGEFFIVRDALLPHKEAIIEPLWRAALTPTISIEKRFRAACALATYDPIDNRWQEIETLVSNHLVNQ